MCFMLSVCYVICYLLIVKQTVSIYQVIQAEKMTVKAKWNNPRSHAASARYLHTEPRAQAQSQLADR